MSIDSAEMNSESERRRKERRSGVETETIKLCVLDSNIFIDFGPEAIFQYGKNNILLREEVRDELNHRKYLERRKGKNIRRTLSLFEKLTELYSVKQIKNGIPLTAVSEKIFDNSSHRQATGLLFLREDECENNPVVYTEAFKHSEIVSVTIKNMDGIEETVPLSKEIAGRVKRAFWDIQDRSILSVIIDLAKKGEHVVLVTGDKHLRGEARLKNICAKAHEQEEPAEQRKRKKRPGRYPKNFYINECN